MISNLKESVVFTESHDLVNGRWYSNSPPNEADKIYFPSVTTVLNVVGKGEGFSRWLGNSISYDHAMDYAGKAASVGSIVHNYAMDLLNGLVINTKDGTTDPDTGDHVKVGFKVNHRLEGFVAFIEDYNPTVIANEMSLYNSIKHEDEYLYPWAGRVDQVYKMVLKEGQEPKTCLVDIKTGGEYKTQGLQQTAYKLLWDSMYPEDPIDEIFCLFLPEKWRKVPYKLKKQKFDPEVWLSVYDLWLWANDNPKPKFKQKEATEFKLKFDDDFELIKEQEIDE